MAPSVAFTGLSHSLPLRGRASLAPSAARPARPAPRMCAAAPGAHRRFLVGGNWKCNLDRAAVTALVGAFNAAPALDADAVEVVVAPPAVYLERVRGALRRDFGVAGQNAWVGGGGAFTGEVSAEMLTDCEADWVILGHSERRHLVQIKEPDAVIAEKARYAVDAGLKVIYCIGELLEEREAGVTQEVCVRQLTALAAAIEEGMWEKIVIAYEPVWAIGTGKVATPQQAEDVHLAVRKWVAENVGQGVGDAVRILYGGSVSPANCNDLARLPDIDGFLVGGCSLKEDFLDIIQSYKVQDAAAV